MRRGASVVVATAAVAVAAVDAGSGEGDRGGGGEGRGGRRRCVVPREGGDGGVGGGAYVKLKR